MSNVTENILLNVETRILTGWALRLGWGGPQIPDTSSTPNEQGVYPLIDNPVTYQMFIVDNLPRYLGDEHVRLGKRDILHSFDSSKEVVDSLVRNGAFDELLRDNNYEEIKRLARVELEPQGPQE